MKLLVSGFVAVGLAAGANAQPGTLKRVDPGHSDVSSASISLKQFDLDLRRPSGFDHVYEVTEANAFGAGQSFMRIDGALTAIFPKSVYIPTPQGMVADIPPSTIFRIGAPPELPRVVGRHSINYVDLRYRELPEDPVDLSARVTAPSLISDEAYRQHRIESLLLLALQTD